MIVKRYIFILLLITGYALQCAPVRIFGNAQDYIGSNIIFYKYSDRISFIREKLFTIEIDSEGNFDLVTDLNEITYVFAEFGIYHVYFYAEPSESYDILLPEFNEKGPAEIFNPFFSPEEIHLGIKGMDKTELNYLIMDFDYYYFKYLDLNFLDVYAAGLKTDVDTFINKLNDRYKDADNQYFQNYKKYRIAALKDIATQKKYETALVYAYYTKEEVLYDNPAYMDLFNNIYDNYFDQYLTGPNGAYLYAIINYGHSISRLKKLMNQNFAHKSPQFRELVILKGLNDSFANKNMPWLPLLLTLDSLHLSTKYPEHQKIAQNIADNALSMAQGTVAPLFELPDTLGNFHKLYDYRGKYVYLHFANTQTYSSQIEFALIKNLYERYKGICIFVTILTDSDKEAAKMFIQKNALEWDFLFAEVNSSVISTYNVTSYPTYFLLDTYGNLLMSPAPSPSENFEQHFFKIAEGKIPKK